MSDTPNKNGRLDSLSRVSTPSSAPSAAAKPSLKFRPKIVARRTKEERDADAPTIVKESSRPARGNGARGRGARGRGRGGRANYAGTRLVSSGPLSSGQVLSLAKSGLGTTPDRVFSSSSTPEFISSLKLKTDLPISRDSTPDSDDDGDPTKINMNREYKFEDSETYLFPVRPNRTEHYEYGDMVVKSESTSVEPEEVKSTTTSPVPEGLEQPVKSESAEISNLPQFDKPIKQKSSSSDPTDEVYKSKNDHSQIVSMLKSLSVKPTDKDNDTQISESEQPSAQKYLMFQLPKILPPFKANNSDLVKSEDGEIITHNQGNIGNIVMDVGQGADTNFLQDAVVIDLHEDKNAYLLGHIDQKILVTPRFI